MKNNRTKSKNKSKNKSRSRPRPKDKTTHKLKSPVEIIKNNTPEWLSNLAKGSPIVNNLKSYTPSINQELVTLNSSVSREMLTNCNNKKAFEMDEPLKISVKNNAFFGHKCVPYYDKDAQEVLFRNLAANKHVVPSKIIPPKQILGNCWFNAMFVMFFISDKGRKFFHFFRQLMIEGKQLKGKPIPIRLRNAFALLNYAVESALVGSKDAVELDTNYIILKIFEAVPSHYRNSHNIPYLDEAGNPIVYYNAIINYLGNSSIKMLVLRDFTPVDSWEERIKREINNKMPHQIPHVIVVEIFDGHNNDGPGNAGKIRNKPISFKVNRAEYSLDSAVVRDISKQHFCAMITCEGKQMGFDGYSYHRLTPSKWKDKINSNDKWEFESTEKEDGEPLKWSFLHSYQMLMYYRVA
jgi:hypothetical protein